jgi:hypothetical protein
MFGSIDCMHVKWTNCPVAWQGFFLTRTEIKLLLLEAICNQSLRIWHAFFGLPGSHNDLNVLDRSPLVKHYMENGGTVVIFRVNETTYKGYYLLADSIYPYWTMFMLTILFPQTDKHRLYARLSRGSPKGYRKGLWGPSS